MSLFTTGRFVKYFEIFSLLYYNNNDYNGNLLFYSVLAYLLLSQFLRMIEFGYMMITGYNYQQMYNNQRYEYLYRPIKVGQSYKNKRIYLFDNGIKKGIRKGISNIFSFFLR